MLPLAAAHILCHPRWIILGPALYLSMTRAEKLFPVLCTVLSVEVSTHVADSDYRPDMRATNLKSEGRMAAPRVNALDAKSAFATG